MSVVNSSYAETPRQASSPEGLMEAAVVDFGEGLHYRARRIVGVDAAEDIVQDTYLAALEHMDSFEPKGKNTFRNWLLTITHNGAVDYIRKEKRRQSWRQSLPAMANTTNPHGNPEVTAEFNATMTELREANKLTFEALMLNIAGFTYPELAKHYGISSEGVAGRAYRGRKAAKLALTGTSPS